jgi:RNA recognition motif-containing protein
MNIFVAKLSYNTAESTLQNAFEAYGEVSSAKIIMDRETGRSKGFAFVEMPNDDEAKQAIDGLNDSDMDGRTIVVKESEPRENRGGGGNRGCGYNRNRF